MRLEIKFN